MVPPLNPSDLGKGHGGLETLNTPKEETVRYTDEQLD